MSVFFSNKRLTLQNKKNKREHETTYKFRVRRFVQVQSFEINSTYTKEIVFPSLKKISDVN